MAQTATLLQRPFPTEYFQTEGGPVLIAKIFHIEFG